MSLTALQQTPGDNASLAISSTLFGRYMLPDMSEYPCQVNDISASGATFVTSHVPPGGQSIVAYLEELGRVEAITGEPVPGGFRVAFALKGSRLERLESRLKWLSEKQIGGAGEENRRHARFEPRDSRSNITLPDGRVYGCEVMDISLSGAAIKVEVLPSLGTYVMLGKMRGRIVRYIDAGVAIEFVRPLDRTQLQEQIK
ncbi:MAG: PilZ domain-containing protein [Aestuariivirga sp.]